MIAVPIIKKYRDYYKYPSLSHFTDKDRLYKKWWKEKAFLANPKHQYHTSWCGEHDGSAHDKKNGDCYMYQSLSQFIDWC